jgi:cyclophilin family peptidyl-prolyl cis-trans isomerase
MTLPKHIGARPLLNLAFLSLNLLASAQPPQTRLKRRDLKMDVSMATTEGRILLRLSDSTPGHRDNFLKLVKTGFYKGISFHRVIERFMIQAGDARTREGGIPREKRAYGDSSYTLAAEIVPSLYHRRGVLAAARMGDDVNPERRSSGSQFYIVQGRVFTPLSLDSVQTYRLGGRILPEAQRRDYLTMGGAPHLDRSYTIFGEVVEGMDVVDRIAAAKTTGRQGGDKPLTPIRITETRLVKRKR